METTPQKDWVLTQSAFDVLLARLDEDQERAGRAYEHIRRGLITFFECRGCAFPEDHADETINRVARALVEGKAILAQNPAAYFYGVAKNVLKEYWKSHGRVSSPLESLPPMAPGGDDARHLHERQAERARAEQRLDCLEGCLQRLEPGDRTLISRYYQGETRINNHNRQSLAVELGIALNALRIRALRIREKLEACVEQCLERSERETDRRSPPT